MAPAPTLEYAGDITPAQAWERLSADPHIQLVDVRTVAEWNFVGLPDLSPLGRRVHCVEWLGFPGGAQNPSFAGQAAQAVMNAGAVQETPVLLLCRSGARSRAAAIALTAAGFSQAFNITGGFEGDPDQDGHRGNVNGWKATGLPWRQG